MGQTGKSAGEASPLVTAPRATFPFAAGRTAILTSTGDPGAYPRAK